MNILFCHIFNYILFVGAVQLDRLQFEHKNTGLQKRLMKPWRNHKSFIYTSLFYNPKLQFPELSFHFYFPLLSLVYSFDGGNIFSQTIRKGVCLCASAALCTVCVCECDIMSRYIAISQFRFGTFGGRVTVHFAPMSQHWRIWKPSFSNGH